MKIVNTEKFELDGIMIIESFKIPETTPFYLSLIDDKLGSLELPYKIISIELTSSPRLVCVRTDINSHVWRYWWMKLRINKSLNLSKWFLIRLLEIWGLVDIAIGKEPEWSDIKIRKNRLRPIA